MTRLGIAFVAVAFAFLAVTSDSRNEKLDAWLRAGSAGLSQAESEQFGRWLHDTLVRNGMAPEVRVDAPGRDNSLRVIVYRNSIPGVFETNTLNAAYDPALDAILIDRRLIFADETLLEFVLLHELGHRARGHRGVSHFAASRSKLFSLQRPPSREEEIEADDYAIESLLRLRETDPSGRKLPIDEVVGGLNSFIEDELLKNFLEGNALGLKQSDLTHPALLDRARSLLDSLSVRPGLSPKAVAEQRAYLDWIERVLYDSNRELSAELLAPTNTTFQRGTETPFGAAFLLSDARIVFVRREEINLPPVESPGAIETQPVGEPLSGVWPPELNSGSAFWWGNGGLYLLRPIGKLYFADPASRWAWKPVARLKLRPGVVALSLSHRPSSTECPSLIFSGMTSVDVYRLVKSGERHMIHLITHVEEPEINRPNRYTFAFGGATTRDLYFWTNAGPERTGATQRVYDIPVRCSQDSAVVPKYVAVSDIETFRMSGVAPYPNGGGFLAIELDNVRGRVIFHSLDHDGRKSRVFELPANARPPGYLQVSRESIYDYSDVNDLYFLSGGRFVGLTLHGWGFYVFDLQNLAFVLGGGLNRMDLLSTPFGGVAAVATTLPGASRILVWSFERRK